MTLKEIKAGNSSRAMQVAVMCLEKDITDPDIIAIYIEKAYRNNTKEFPNRRIRQPRYIARLTQESFDYLNEQGLLNQAA